MSEPDLDLTVQRLREEISDLDRAILDAINARLVLVGQLKQHKAEHGIPFVDPDRERQLLDVLLAANRGPLSDAGLRELFCELLDLTKREVSQDGGP
jgi:3-deoxy-7-phosphoheptulonate synthase/chorismate mutase